MNGDSLATRFAAQMGALLGPDFPKTVGLAVSGGGDSMAMLALAHDWARVMGVELKVATIDHGLRDGSAAEARMVGEECARLGHSHDVLHWDWDGTGNLQDAARRGRLDLIGQWCAATGLRQVLFAHTRDDQAETLLLRLARGSGVEGLSAMAPRRRASVPGAAQALLAPRQPGSIADGAAESWEVLRPLLAETRDDLRHHIQTLKVPYVDDPSNDDPRFDRVRARAALGHLAELGVTTEGLAATATRLWRARDALEARAWDVAQRVAVEGSSQDHPTGEVLFNRDGFAEIERDTQMRLLSAALRWVAQNPYRPRSGALEASLDRALAGGGSSLHGCLILCDRRQIRIAREPQAVLAEQATPSNPVWDRRWGLSGDAKPDVVLRALGEDGWRQIADKPNDAPPFATALSLPAVFLGDRLLHCPQLGVTEPSICIRFAPNPVSFAAALISH